MNKNTIRNIEEHERKILLNLYLDDTPLWPVIRYSLRKHSNIPDTKPSLTQNYAKINLRRLFNFIGTFASILSNYRFKSNSYTNIFLENVDRMDKEVGDIYTYSVKSGLSDYAIFLRPSLRRSNKITSQKKRVFSLGSLYIKFAILKQIYNKNKFRSEELVHLSKKYSFDIEYVISDLVRFSIFQSLYRKLFNRISVKNVYLYAGYNITNLAFVKAANQYGVNTIEIQHGNFTKSDYNYHSYLDSLQMFDGFFSNYFLCFNDKFKMMLHDQTSVFHESRILKIGFPIISLIKDNNWVADEIIRILVIPTTTLTKPYVTAVIELINMKRNNIIVDIRFHPSIINVSLENEVKNLFSEKVGIDKSLWKESILKYDYFIGEYSTTLLEAESIGKVVYLLDSEISLKSDLVMQNPQHLSHFTYKNFDKYTWNYEIVRNLEKNLGVVLDEIK